ncbi:hypothetical protein [Actinocorallia sp. A-T 12471]|uniref:hypothetical protein n=1 Tax=Actinocorallia sp. A-T 12471 TaxID=3089813 RepID=UPI0029D1449C|nr:hypothetical protein [Actinocorallia sp. A-T 12471]MDX6739418.1 hypothetical protein [Actinocorallia sp. A-T 12471]
MGVFRVVGAAVSAGAVLVGVPSAAVGTQKDAEWRLVKTVEARYGKGFSGFDQVVALGPSNAFAFGQGNGAEFSTKPTSDLLAYRYDGKTWRHTKLPPKIGNGFGPVAAVNRTSVFAVATFQRPEAPTPPRAGHYSSTLVRWNGTKWSVVRKWQGYSIRSMAVLGSKNVWVFGSRVVKGRFKPVALHYDGRSWKERTTPYVVAAVTKGPKGRLFATGYKPHRFFPEGDGTPRALRFDGKRWRTLSDPVCKGATLLAAHRGRPVGTCLKENAKDVSVGTFVSWNGSSWKAERPSAAHGWDLGEPVSAGAGGLWFVGVADSGSRALFHRSSSGKWTRTVIAPEPLGGSYTNPLGRRHLAVLPGLGALVRVGGVDDADGNPVGAIARLDGL